MKVKSTTPASVVDSWQGLFTKFSSTVQRPERLIKEAFTDLVSIHVRQHAKYYIRLAKVKR